METTMKIENKKTSLKQNLVQIKSRSVTMQLSKKASVTASQPASFMFMIPTESQETGCQLED